MTKRTLLAGLVGVWSLAAVGTTAFANQDTANEPAADQQPASTTELTAKVVEVTGDVTTAPTGTDPLDKDAWKPVKVDDRLAGGTMIRTGLRSQLILLFGDDTVINVKRMTLASVDAFYQTDDAKKVQLGLGYGAIRGGSAEGALRSDVVIDSPVATLAKRGTEGFEMSVEPYTGRFSVSLARRGLVEALQKRTGQRKLVRRGEYANELNIAKLWVKQDQFDRQVKVLASESMTKADLDFSVANRRGLGGVVPGNGDQTLAFNRRDLPNLTNNTLRDRLPLVELQNLLPTREGTRRFPVIRREGNFGVSSTVPTPLPDIQFRRVR